MSRRASALLAASAVALVASLPFAPGLLRGHSLYFRDLALQFFPARLYALQGLRAGELRYWNPLTHEGVPVGLPPVAYLPDLLQLLRPDALGLSATLSAHVPLAGVAFFVLARQLGLTLAASVLGGVVYALSGFTLSTLNLYVYVQAVAWAPFVIAALRRAADAGAGAICLAAVCLGMQITTTGAEVVAQTLIVAAALIAGPISKTRAVRFSTAIALGAGLSAFTILPMSAVVAGGERAQGFPTAVVLAHSVHPLTFVQTLVSAFYGDPANITGRWWGIYFFTRGFPYFVSLYLGATVVALALTGVWHGSRWLRRTLALLALAAAIVCLGRYVGLAALVDLLPPLHAFRYPTKAFFTLNLVTAALAALGVDAVVRATPRAARTLAITCSVLGGSLVAALVLPALAPGATRFFLNGFLPVEYPWPLREAVGRFILNDAAQGGALALVAGLIAGLAAAGRLSGAASAAAVTAIIGVDLLRAGSGLSPMVTPDFYRLSPEMARESERFRTNGDRIFTCDPAASPAFIAARGGRGVHHEMLVFGGFMETLVPDFNLPFGVATAVSEDRTGLVPQQRALSTEDASCADFSRIEPRLRAAGVTRVLSLEPLTHPSLIEESAVRPERVAPLTIRVYKLDRPLPLREVPYGRIVRSQETPTSIDLDVEADRATEVIVRDSLATGWMAYVNDARTPISRAGESHRAVPIPAGTSRVRLTYQAPRLIAGVCISLLSAVVLAALAVRDPWRGTPRT